MPALNLVTFSSWFYVYFSDYWNYFRVLRKERAEGIPEGLKTERHIIENVTANVLSVFVKWIPQ